MGAEIVAMYHSMGSKVIEQKDRAKAKLLEAREAKFAALEKKNNIEMRLRYAITKRAGGWKGLGPNDTARNENLSRYLAQSKVLMEATKAYHQAVAEENRIEAGIETLDDYRKMHQSALQALGGHDR